MAQVKANYNLDFISVGCNRVTNGVDWGFNNLIVYAAHKFVAIFDPDDGKIIATLPGHKNRVNCVKWLPNVEADYATRWQQKEVEIASASADRNIVIWKYRPESGKYQASAVLTGHEDSVNSLAVLDLEDGSLLLASCSGDRTVRIWKRTSPKAGNTWSLAQTISFPKMMETVALALLPGSQIPILAIAGVDHVIHLYAQPEATFAKVSALTGHEDWIRCMSFVHTDENTLLLATAAQDRRIRLWAFKTEKNIDSTQEDATSALLSKLALTDNAHFDISDISQRGLIAKITADKAYSIILDSVLVGHDDWVLGLSWAPATIVEGRKHQPLQLLSASMDRSMIVWTHDDAEQLWTECARVGDIGGNHLGFFGAAYAKTGRYILASGYNGAFHLWKQRVAGEDDAWEPHVPASGHFDEVRDISWDPKQQYLMSVSKDQTARLFGVWQRPEDYGTINPERQLSTRSWNEVARPQVHGYDLNCLTFVNNHSHRFASGAEEKVIRVFDAPKSFVTSFNNITKLNVEDKNEEDRPMGANMGPLGLTNKPVFEKKAVEKSEEEKMLEQIRNTGGGDDDEGGGSMFDDETSIQDRAPLILTAPPVEEQLLQRTLWAECQKLYGHGNELLTLAANTSGELMASACKGTNTDQSAIRIWDTNTWREKAVLKAHNLSTIQLAFSHDDKYLLGVSRDRTYSVFSTKKNEQGAYEFKLLKKFKAHTRILWSCDWSPNDAFFVTGSRDKTAKLWRTSVNAQTNEPDWLLDSTLAEFKSAVTAVAFAPVCKNSHASLPFDYLLAVGLESGAMSLWTAVETKEGDKTNLKWSNLLTVDTSHAHVETVKRLRWRLVSSSAEQLVFDLASCSTDHSIRIFHVTVALK